MCFANAALAARLSTVSPKTTLGRVAVGTRLSHRQRRAGHPLRSLGHGRPVHEECRHEQNYASPHCAPAGL